MFMNRVRSLQEAEKYTKLIRRLLVDDFHTAKEILPLCSNLESLALFIHPQYATSLEPMLYPAALPFTNLRRLSILWEMLPSEHRSLHHLIFQGLTHLEINRGYPSFWDGLFQLNNLIHLRLNMLDLRQIDNIIDDTFYENLFGTAFETILSRLPTSTKYFTCVLEADQRKIVNGEFGHGILMDIQSGRFSLRFNWSPPAPQAYATWIAKKNVLRFERDLKDMEDAADSWIHLPRHYHDFWRRSQDEIDKRRRPL